MRLGIQSENPKPLSLRIKPQSEKVKSLLGAHDQLLSLSCAHVLLLLCRDLPPLVGFFCPFCGLFSARVGHFAALCRLFPAIFLVGLPSMGIVWIFLGFMWICSWMWQDFQQLQMLGTKWPQGILPSRVAPDYPLRLGVDLSKAPFGEPPKNRITWSLFTMVKPIRLSCCLLGWCLIFKPFLSGHLVMLVFLLSLGWSLRSVFCVVGLCFLCLYPLCYSVFSFSCSPVYCIFCVFCTYNHVH